MLIFGLLKFFHPYHPIRQSTAANHHQLLAHPITTTITHHLQQPLPPTMVGCGSDGWWLWLAMVGGLAVIGFGGNRVGGWVAVAGVGIGFA